jgi:transposase InsO family protein
MQERLGFVMDVLEGRYDVAEACERRGISRKTGYKYLNRYLEEGVAGLAERSRRPHSCPHATTEEVRELLIGEKKRRPTWGPKKLIERLQRRDPSLALPAVSTASGLLKSAGWVKNRRRSRQVVAPPLWKPPRTEADAPNRVWTIDFKGEFRLGNQQLCYPLTLVDLYSRDLRAVAGLTSTRGLLVKPVLERVFQKDGLPEVIRSDNGNPFVGNALGGLSRLAVWWVKLGIRLERIQPGHPEQNGAHERMHRTLKAETTRPPRFNLADQQQAFDAFRGEYNEQRPHEALDMRTPSELYTTSPRPFPAVLPTITYPGHFERRRVRQDGCIKWCGSLLFVSETLEKEEVGLEEIDDGQWSLYFGSILLGRFSNGSRKVHADYR